MINEKFEYNSLFLLRCSLLGGFLCSFLSSRLLFGGSLLSWLLNLLSSWLLNLLSSLLSWLLGGLLFSSFRLLCLLCHLGLLPELETSCSLSRSSGHLKCSLLDSRLERHVEVLACLGCSTL